MATASAPFSVGTDYDSLSSTEDRGPSVVKAAIALMCLSTFAVALRLYSRKIAKLDMLLSDWVLIVALVFTLGFSALEIVAATHGLGKHILRNTLDNDVLLLQLLFSEGFLYTSALTSTKLSMLLLYRTIFPTSPTRAFRLAAYSVAALCIAWGISTLLASIFTCKPISDYWNILKVDKDCLDQKAWYTGTSIANVVIDGMILVLPVVSVWQLHLSWKQKLSVSGLFLLGGFVIVASIIRLVVLVNVAEDDITWSYYGVAIWSLIEINVAVISTCLPTLRPLLIAAAPWLSRLGLSLRSFVPGSRGRVGYNNTGSVSVRGRRKQMQRQDTIPVYGSSSWTESLQGYPYCETKVQSEPVAKENKRGPRRVQSDEEMAELVPIPKPNHEGGIMVQKDVVQTWNRMNV